MKIFKRIYIPLIFLCLAGSLTVFAQGGPSWSGYIEATYNHNVSGDTTVNLLRSYDARSKQILLNNVHLLATGSPTEKLSYTAEIDFGTDAGVHGLLHQVGGGSPIGIDIQEAYMTYAFTDRFKFTGGKFVTFEGIEVIEGPANPTISRGFLYGLAEPFHHVGAYFTFIPLNALDIKLGVVNGWDLLIDNNTDKTIIGRIGVNLGDPLAFGISVSHGVEQVDSDDPRFSIDLTGVTRIIQALALNFQLNYGSETVGTTDATWMGFGIQPLITLSTLFDLGLRLEYFSDDDGVRTGVADFNVLNFTVVPTFKFDGFTVRAEYRLDSGNKEVFPVSQEDPSKSQSTISLGVSCNL